MLPIDPPRNRMDPKLFDQPRIRFPLSPAAKAALDAFQAEGSAPAFAVLNALLLLLNDSRTKEQVRASLRRR